MVGSLIDLAASLVNTEIDDTYEPLTPKDLPAILEIRHLGWAIKTWHFPVNDK
jgi:hypothetical protein